LKFIDEATIEVQAGHGGSGCKHFRREKYVPYGGPDGGNGGLGGSVILVADENIQTLLDFKYKPKWKAENGDPGQGARKDGRAGSDLIIKVPVGTQVLTPETEELLADLSEAGQRYVIARGGRGGLGNAAFKSATNRTPEYFQPGELGEGGTFLLSLKLVADVGLIGLPNAGKSTLISRISAAKPKIADYPFTTLIPNLGVVKLEERTFVVADIPGLIPDAHRGKGLGIRFLKHVERTKALVHLIDITPAVNGDFSLLIDAYNSIRFELAAFSEDLASRHELVVLTKCDAVTSEIVEGAILEFKKLNIPASAISSISGQGLDPLCRTIADLIFSHSDH
jgi:GTP-binding protein